MIELDDAFDWLSTYIIYNYSLYLLFTFQVFFGGKVEKTIILKSN